MALDAVWGSTIFMPIAAWRLGLLSVALVGAGLAVLLAGTRVAVTGTSRG